MSVNPLNKHELKDAYVYQSFIKNEHVGKEIFFRELGRDQQGVDLCWSFSPSILDVSSPHTLQIEGGFINYCSLKKSTPFLLKIKEMFLRISELYTEETSVDNISNQTWDKIVNKINVKIKDNSLDSAIDSNLNFFNDDGLYKGITKDIADNIKKIRAIADINLRNETNIDIFINVYASVGNQGVDEKLVDVLLKINQRLYSSDRINDCISSKLGNLCNFFKNFGSTYSSSLRILIHNGSHVFKILRNRQGIIELTKEAPNELLANHWVVPSSIPNSNHSFQSSIDLERRKIVEHLKQFSSSDLSCEELEKRTRSFCVEEGIKYRNYLDYGLDLLTNTLNTAHEKDKTRIQNIIQYIQNILSNEERKHQANWAQLAQNFSDPWKPPLQQHNWSQLSSSQSPQFSQQHNWSQLSSSQSLQFSKK